ncbi:MAG: sporulation initiation factor Spo0A C-terminal domain-containing protein [Lachnospiraceae bacterium]|nr:sporulation initiation factor Spo0A C-terminal domain-containing protein [Lachnospiraceae bacterium]
MDSDFFETDDNLLHDLILSIGIPPNIYGYSYIIHAMKLIMADPGYLHSVTKGLYIDIAKEFHTKPARVERAIRHAINTAWLYGDLAFIDSIFKNCVRPDKAVPSNSVFLARLYFYLKGLEYKQA